MLLQPTIILLSAKDNERLLEQVRQLAAAIDKKKLTDKDLINISFTLSVGREHMEERLALLVHSIADLMGKLDIYIASDKNIVDSYRGSTNSNKEIATVFSKEEEFEHAVDKLLKNRKYGKVLDLWTKGVWIDWTKYYHSMEVRPHSISLPTYPFAKEKYWIPTEMKQSLIPSSQSGTIHPLVQENTSDLSGQRFSSKFSGIEDFIHSIDEGNHYLSELAHLEMIRVAAKRSMTVTKDSILVLKDVEWIEPAIIDKNTMVHIALYPSINGDLEWEIYAQNEASEEEPEVNSEGKLSRKEAMEAVPQLQDLRSRFQTKHTINTDKASKRIEKYMEEIWSDHDEDRKLLVRFKKIEEKSDNGYKELEVLHAGMLEACLETVNVNKKGSSRAITMKKIEISVQSRQPVWGMISTKNSDRDVVSELDIRLYDESEKVVASITGLRFETRDMEEYRPVEQKPVSIEQNEMMTFEETWQESALTLKEKTLRTLVIFVTDENRRQMIEKSIKQLSPDTEI
ncbi:KS-MAT linker domain-containing protein, partial [Niallia sp. HCP3S3_B10]|uniref:KS-MAT linker domain-containing protein n=1 Tax=Niallia sp. HCP3S3_B10 TaxID=3438944 RepID=UPI003F88CA42